MTNKNKKLKTFSSITLALHIAILFAFTIFFIYMIKNDFAYIVETIFMYAWQFCIPVVIQVLLCKFIKNKNAMNCYGWLIVLEVVSILYTLYILIPAILIAGVPFIIAGIFAITIYVFDIFVFKEIVKEEKAKRKQCKKM